MKTLEQLRKEIESDPMRKKTLEKLEGEYERVKDTLTEDDLKKYGLTGRKEG